MLLGVRAAELRDAGDQRLFTYPARSPSLAARSRSSRARATRERMVPIGHALTLAAPAKSDSAEAVLTGLRRRSRRDGRVSGGERSLHAGVGDLDAVGVDAQRIVLGRFGREAVQVLLHLIRRHLGAQRGQVDHLQ